MDRYPRSDWTPQMIADFKLFYEELQSKKKEEKKLSHDVECAVRADMNPLDIGV